MQEILLTRRTSMNLSRKAKRDLSQAVVFLCDQTCWLATALQDLSLARDEPAACQHGQMGSARDQVACI